jgi:hypothetical protein
MFFLIATALQTEADSLIHPMENKMPVSIGTVNLANVFEGG